jgi:hypothetical protein
MIPNGISGAIRIFTAAAGFATMVAVVTPKPVFADESGVSFWVPGLFGSLAATPGVLGWAISAVYFHSQVSSEAGKSFSRGGRIEAGLDGTANIALYGATYVFQTPFLGAQAAISMFGVAGRNDAAISATLSGPLGNSISGRREDGRAVFGDLIPQATLKWNHGVHNFMVYGTGDIPVGAYDPARLSNLGIGHGAIDGGGGYTYFNPQSGNEFSVTTGFTYNFKNPDTNYQNGVDWHIDTGVSHFFTKQFHIGAVGYFFQQITDDSGSGATLGAFRSRVAGIGPQAGYIFPAGDMQGYLNLKAYKEFAAENRPEGWNFWVTFVLSPKAPEHEPPLPAVRK